MAEPAHTPSDNVLAKVPAVTLGFWLIKILATTLGETGGDWLDKPVAKGGLELSRLAASVVPALVILALILILPQRPGGHPTSRP